MPFLLLSHLKAFAVVFKLPNGKPFGCQKFEITENICGRCPHPQPLKRLTKLLTLGRKVWLLLYFVARLKLSKMSLEYFTQKLPLSISQGELII